MVIVPNVNRPTVCYLWALSFSTGILLITMPSPQPPFVDFFQPRGRTARSTASARKESLFDDEFFRKLTLYNKLAPPTTPASPAPEPAARELTSVLHEWLSSVPVLLVSGSNYPTWIAMIQKAFEVTLERSMHLTDPDLILDASEDQLLKTALLTTIDDNLKLGVVQAGSGLAGLRLLSDTFVPRSHTSHMILFQELLDMKFDHLDPQADVGVHFRRLENKVRVLFLSEFELSEDSFKALLSHLSLPNLAHPPSDNVARQLDQRMDVLRLTKYIELALFRQHERANNDCQGDRSGTPKPDGNKDALNLNKPSNRNQRSKCKTNTRFTGECSENSTSRGASGSSEPFQGSTRAPSQPFRGKPALPRANAIHPVSVNSTHPELSQENLKFITAQHRRPLP
ncbi:hypothetical protein PCANC_16945 [Puccinia coronata f. sp. avenae]|uniref:Uncharacterized protein n=1 Tax=Puccinia coronata f. sp. avenae TaxID=200324 RepID=A0A2N5V5N7_9BASI|nr:hypothetical protein PCANC_16945 [Puccinia coronata f. sp. avenae]